MAQKKITAEQLDIDSIEAAIGSPLIGGGGGTGNVRVQGSPAATELAIWTTSNTIQGQSTLTYDGTDLTIGGSNAATDADVTVAIDTALGSPRGSAIEGGVTITESQISDLQDYVTETEFSTRLGSPYGTAINGNIALDGLKDTNFGSPITDGFGIIFQKATGKWVIGSVGGSPSAGITAIVQDTSPQLGGDLDTNGFQITSTSGVVLDGITYPNSPGTASQVLTVGSPLTSVNWVDPTEAILSITDDGAASRTLTLTDAKKLIRMTSGSANSVLVPADATTNFEVGTRIYIEQQGAGQTTIEVGSPAPTITGPFDEPFELREQYSLGVLVKTASNNWLLSGDLKASQRLNIKTVGGSPTAYTLQINDGDDEWIRFSGTEIRVPRNGLVAIPNGAQITIRAVQNTVNVVPFGSPLPTINAGIGTGSPNLTFEAGATIGLVKVDTDEWDVV